MGSEMDIRIGCCGLPVGEKKYYSKFKVLEVEETFYGRMDAEEALILREGAPGDFEFTVKADRIITEGSFAPTNQVYQAWGKLEEVSSILKSKIIVFETPPSFTSDKVNRDNIINFFKKIDRDKYTFIWDPQGSWLEEEISRISSECGLIRALDPFNMVAQKKGLRYFRLSGVGSRKYKYTGLDLKKLQDLSENEARLNEPEAIYIMFNNFYMMGDAERFAWIIKNTARIKEINVAFLRDLCHEIEAGEEDEKIKRLTREAERIITLILHTDYARVDIEIEKSKLRELCKELFPGKEFLYEMIYARRFDRIWEQFREKKGEIK